MLQKNIDKEYRKLHRNPTIPCTKFGKTKQDVKRAAEKRYNKIEYNL